MYTNSKARFCMVLKQRIAVSESIVNSVLISKTLLLIRFDSFRRLSIRCAPGTMDKTDSAMLGRAAQLGTEIYISLLAGTLYTALHIDSFV